MGTRKGLFVRACGTPENHTGLRFGERMGWVDGTETGMTLGDSFRSGKYDTRGVPGGGRVRPNSAARDESGVCLEDRAMRRLVLLETRPTRDCGVISFAKTRAV